MALRKWLVRGLVMSFASVIGLAALLYQQYTNPEAVRQLVLTKLAAQFAGAHVSLESAHMRLFGGIALNELRITRRDDPDRTELLYVPTSTIHIDRENLTAGKLVIRQIELHKPRLRIIHNADGTWNFSGLLAATPASDPDEPIPVLVLQQAVLQIEEHDSPSGIPPFEIKDINLKVVNDPAPTILFEGRGSSDGIGIVHIKGTVERASGSAELTFNLAQIRVGSIIERLAALNPDLVKHAIQLDGVGSLEGTVEYHPGSQEPLHWDLKAGLANGRFAHAKLPLPLDQIEASAHIVNKEIPEAKIVAKSGSTIATVEVEDFTPERLAEKGDPDHPVRLEGLFKKLDVLLEHISVTKEFFDLVPKEYQVIETDYQPRGPATIRYVFTRDDPITGTRYCKITPENAKALVDDFRYRYIERVTGAIEFTSGKNKDDLITLNLVGHASNQPIKVVGEIRGERPNHEVKIEISGQNIPLDETLKAALPEKYIPIAESFHPFGSGEFIATISRSPKTKQFANRYWVKFHDCKVCYEVFPYPLERVSGILDILPDKHFEFRDFRGFHKGGEFYITGRSFKSPTKVEGQQDRLEMSLVGKNFILDRELREAVARSVDDPGMPRAWDAFDPKGRVNFNGTVIVPAAKTGETKPEIDLTVLPQGCRIKPTFFAYEMTDLFGTLHYKEGNIEVTDARARHGKSVLTLNKGDIVLKPKGGVYAVLHKIEANPLVPDAAIVNALPTMLKKGCEVLQITDPLRFSTKLIADTTGEPGEKPDLYWDGKISAKDITVHTGITLEHVSGEIACHGRYNPAELEAIDRATEKPKGLLLLGNLNLESATLFSKEKFNQVRGAFYVTKADRDVLQLEEIMADFCGGKVYGPLRIEFGPVVRYSTNLTASNIDVREFARLNFDKPDDVNGKATIRVALQGKGSDPENLEGKGIIEIPNGKLYNLPVILGLLKFLGLRLPDKTAFEEVYAAFNFERGRAVFTQVKMLGDAFSMQGKGNMKLDGSDINMEFNVGWARMAQAIPAVSYVETAISGKLFKIKMKGELGNVTYIKEPIPVILDPVKRLFGDNNDTKKRALSEGAK
jgi:hypothetical protein